MIVSTHDLEPGRGALRAGRAAQGRPRDRARADRRDADGREHPRALRRRRGRAVPSTRRSPDGGAHWPRALTGAGACGRAPVRQRVAAGRWPASARWRSRRCLLAPLVGSTRDSPGARLRSVDPVCRQRRRADLLRRPPAARARRRRSSAARSRWRASCSRRCCAIRWRRPTRSASRPAPRSAR